MCNVHSHPPATVHWYKNHEMQLTNDSATLRHLGHRYTLVIDSLRGEDFGNYTCRASNREGDAARVLEISRKRILYIIFKKACVSHILRGIIFIAQ